MPREITRALIAGAFVRANITPLGAGTRQWFFFHYLDAFLQYKNLKVVMSLFAFVLSRHLPRR